MTMITVQLAICRGLVEFHPSSPLSKTVDCVCQLRRDGIAFLEAARSTLLDVALTILNDAARTKQGRYMD